MDLNSASLVGHSLLEALTTASLHHGDVWSYYALVHLKTQLAGRLVVGKPGKEKEETLEGCLSSFASLHKGMATRMAEAFKSFDSVAFAARLQEITTKFPPAELEAYSMLAVRRFQPDMACQATEGHECKFRPVVCPHEGCKARCSFNSLEVHDAGCPHKLMACEKCGEMIPRCELGVHRLAACPKRDATCTFSCIGCQVPVQHCDLERHLDSSTQGHLMLLMRCVIEQQELVHVLNARVKELETTSARTSAANEAELKANATLTAQVAGLEAKLAALDNKVAQDLKKSCDVVGDGAKKRVDAMEKDTKKRFEAAEKTRKIDLGTVRSDVADIRASFSKLGKLQADVEELKAASLQHRVVQGSGGSGVAAGSTLAQPGAGAGA